MCFSRIKLVCVYGLWLKASQQEKGCLRFYLTVMKLPLRFCVAHKRLSIVSSRDVCQLSDSLTSKMIFDASVCNSDSQRLSGDVIISENNRDVSIALSAIVTADSITDRSDVAR